MSDVLIGKSRLDGRSAGTGGKWFYLEDNKPNVYRVMPPLHSLARTGEYAKYYATHKVKGTDGKQRSFGCIQEKDYKTKTIVRRCPMCDKAEELKAKLTAAQQAGQISKEEASTFDFKNIWPLKAEKKYYLNVVNQEGVPGILPISITMYQDLQNTLQEWDKKGFDLTGKTGAFLNFTISKKYKGDKDAVHKVVPFTNVNPDGSFTLVRHELTAEFINEKLAHETRDLGKLFREVSDEQLAAIAATDGLERAQFVDNMFKSGEPKSKVESEKYSDQVKEAHEGVSASRLEARIPGTQAKAVTNMDVTETGIKANTPTDFLNMRAPSSSLPKNELPTAPVPAPTPQQAPAKGNFMAREDFMSMFAGKK